MRKRQRGQASVEFVVLAFVLVPLIIIVPLLGKYIDLAQTTTVASRYVAFEGTVHHGSSRSGWKAEGQLANEVRRRFYSRNDLGINTNDVVGEVPSDRNPLWVDHRNNPLLPSFNLVTVQTERETIDQPAGAIFANNFDLDQNNLYTGTVGVNVANVPNIGVAFDKARPTPQRVFDNLNLQMNRSTTVLVDPWAARGPADVKRKVEDAGLEVYPTGHLEGVATLATPIMTMLEIVFGGNGTKPPEVGEVDPDIVPTDRLEAY